MSQKRKIDRALREHAESLPTVALAYLYGVDVAAGFANSLAALLWVQGQRKDRAQLVTDVIAEHSGVNVAGGRNKVMQRFLAESKADWLLMVDADMTFTPDLPDALLSCADADPEAENYAPIVGGLCFGVSDGRLFPTMYDFRPDEQGRLTTVRYESFPRDAMFQVGATGAACLLVHRSVVEEIGCREFNKVYPWFQETELAGERCGEDITFCIRAAAAGFPVYVNTAVPVGHQKAHVLTLDMYRAQRLNAGRPADVVQTEDP
jgi:hypothetical protein